MSATGWYNQAVSQEPELAKCIIRRHGRFRTSETVGYGSEAMSGTKPFEKVFEN